MNRALSIFRAALRAEGSSIFIHDPSGKAAQAYQRLAEEVLSE